MPVSTAKINLLMELTEKELSLKTREKDFQRETSAKERTGKYATFYLNLKQEKSPKIWPENVLNRFKVRIKIIPEIVTNTFMDLIAESVEIFVRTIQIVIYIFIIGIVVATTLKIAQIVHRKIWKSF